METVVGSPVIRVDALEKVRGAAVFGADVRLVGMLYGAVLHSPHASARILSIDVSEALKIHGVRAVATGADMPDILAGEGIKDMPFLAVDRVRYVGEPVVAVAADDEETALKAVKLIKVEYEELTPVLDALEALKPDAPLVHESMMSYKRIGVLKPVPGTNVLTLVEYNKGNLEEGFAKADHIFEDTYRSQTVQHAALEPHSAVAQLDVNGRLTVWAPNDSPHRLRKDLGDAMGWPLNRIRCISTYIGGGFGGKGGLKAEPVAIALAFKSNHRPVKIVYSREEVFAATLVRHAVTVTIKTGVMNDGTLVARDVKGIWDTGAYAEKGPIVCIQATGGAAGPYVIPNARMVGYCMYTNKVIAGAYRGYGVPQLVWAYESQMDEIAKKLGIDPVELRLKNVLHEGDVNPMGMPVHSVGVEECVRQAAKGIGWDQRNLGPRHPGPGRYRGIGFACSMKNTKTPSGSAAVIYMSQDGRVNVASASVEVGQGIRTALAQIVSEVLGVPVSEIVFTEPDSDVTPFDSSTTSSRSTFHMGNAAKFAAEDVRDQLRDLGSIAFGCLPEECIVTNGRVERQGHPEQSLSYEEVLKKQYGAGAGLTGKGFYYPPSTVGKPLHGSPSLFWMYSAHAAEVEVDAETGKVTVKRIVAAADMGKAINPINCLQQTEGGTLHAMSTAMLEEVLLDKKGRMSNPNFHDYKIATAVDAPEILPVLVEAPHCEGPFGAKGIGEIITTSVAAAISNAINDAVGIRIKELPLSAPRVLAALKEKGLQYD